jgi:hypothetical protein
LEAEKYDRFDLRVEHNPWLESVNETALRTHPAGPIGDPSILRQRLICSIAEGWRDSYQASRWCSQRQPVPGFEPGIMFGTKIETKMNPFQTDPPPMFDYL